MSIRAALAAAAIALAVPTTGAAGDDDEEFETESVTRVSCIGGTAQLLLEAEAEAGAEDDDEDDDEDGGRIAVELRVTVPRPVAVWRLVLLHERRMVYSGTRRSTRSGYSFRYLRYVPEWEGRQTVAARLATPSGRTCRLEATI